MPLLDEAWERRQDDPTLEPRHRRQLQLAVAMGAIPADYFQYYYFTDEILAELPRQADDARRGHPRRSPDYWRHYEEQAQSDDPQLDPARSRGGIHELELAIDVMDAIFNDKDEVHPVNMPNAGGALPGFPDDLVVEVLGRCHARRDRRAPAAAAATPRPRPRRDARRVPGARRGDGLERHARRRRPGAQPPTRSSARSRSPSASTTRSRPRTATTCPTACSRSRRWRELAPARCRRWQHEDASRSSSTADGTVVGSGSGGMRRHPQRGGPEPALAEIVRACDGALEAAGATAADLAAAAFSLAGADWPEDFVSCAASSTRRLGLRRRARGRQRRDRRRCAAAPRTWSASRW